MLRLLVPLLYCGSYAIRILYCTLHTTHIMAWHTQYRLWLLFLMCFFFFGVRSCVGIEFFARLFHHLNNSCKPNRKRLLFARGWIDMDACLTNMLRTIHRTAIRTHAHTSSNIGKKSHSAGTRYDFFFACDTIVPFFNHSSNSTTSR